jgi:pyridoxal phosphate enzyme (YggS family)
MNTIKTRLQQVRKIIEEAALRYQRNPDDIALLAVSKTRPASDILDAIAAGQKAFGESYLQEALDKISDLKSENAQWHFIGRIQSNKTRPIAEHFDWVHSVQSLKQARRLNEQRPETLQPLNICLQVMIDREESKSGMLPDEVGELLKQACSLSRIRVRGLMTLPAPADTLAAQRRPFRELRELRDRLATPGMPLETLSMGMSGDLEAAIAEGATIVRVGTAIFGPRNPVARGQSADSTRHDSIGDSREIMR